MITKDIFSDDPGANNEFSQLIDNDEISTKLYTEQIINTLHEIDYKKVDDAALEISKSISNGGIVITAGNGGSLAIAQHAACDLGKGLFRFYKGALQVRALGTNAATASALANDFGYDAALAAEYQMVKSAKKNVVIVISSSGNSDNIYNLMQSAKEDGDTVIALTGFSGGKVSRAADISFYIPLSNYPAVELLHQHFFDLLLMRLWKI
jgi:D-sedoheptulose 7-phosphate isomerase